MKNFNTQFEFNKKFGFTPMDKPVSGRGWAENFSVNIPELIKFLQVNRNPRGCALFDYNQFKGSWITTRYDFLEKDFERINIPFFLDVNGKNNVPLQLNIKLNKGNDYIDFSKNSLFRIQFDASYKKATYFLLFAYDSYSKYGDEERIAIEISSTNFSHLHRLRQYLNIDITQESKEWVKTEFDKAFALAKNDPSTLKMLYEEATDFVLMDRNDELKWQDILTLLKYDKEGSLSWFRDASSALVNIISNCNDLQSLYNKLEADPYLVIDLYEFINGENAKNYCVLLKLLCEFFSIEKHLATKKHRITTGKGYYITQQVGNYKDPENPKENSYGILLKVMKPGGVEEFDYKAAPFDRGMNQSFIVDLPETAFHPLDMVELHNAETGLSEFVPAIFIKYLLDTKKWESIIEVVTIVISVIGLLLGVGAIIQGVRGLALVISIVDVTVSATDLALMIEPVRKFLSQSEEGKWFLDHWNEISLIGQAGFFGPLLAKGIIKNGPQLLARLVRGAISEGKSLIQFIEKLIVSAKVEFYIAAHSKPLMVTFEPFSVFAVHFGEQLAKKMVEVGVLLSKDLGNEARILVYRGQKLVEGDLDEIKNVLRKIFSKKGDDLIRFLDDFLITKNFDDIASFRVAKKISAFNQLDGATGTVAKIEIDGKPFFGINSGLSPDSLPLRRKWFEIVEFKPPRKHLGRARSLNHAEAHAIMEAHEYLKHLPSELTLYVDRVTCWFCQNELPYLMKAVGIKELTIYNAITKKPLKIVI
jgi:hypothetical protein